MKKWIIGIIILLLLIITPLVYFDRYDIVLGVLVMFMPLFDMLLILGIGFGFYYFGQKIGRNKARKEFKKEVKKLELENPYIYFRDIPNKYGVGVSLALLNYKVDKEDVLAAILDLCAKGYIRFNQVGKSYEIFDTKKDRSVLLENELYLLNWVLNKDKRKIKIKEWISLAKEDAINLGLAFKNDKKEYKPLFDFNPEFAKKLYVVSIILSFFIVSLIDIYFKINNAIFVNVFMSLLFSGPIWLFLFFFLIFIAVLYDGKILTYNEIKNNKLILNDLGKNEYHELYSLGKFLNDFGRLDEKSLGEIVIWEQYLSYALIFRISKNIIKTGYKDLLINDCFVINDIDKIKII